MEERTTSSWQRFWERGGGWKALLLAAVYYGVYQLLSLLVGLLPESVRDASPASTVFFDTALPILLGCLVLIAFAASLGWVRELFARQSLGGRGWMWVAIGIVLAINVSALLGIDYADAGFELVATWLLTGLFVGFAEEVLTRGFVVNLMRKAGHGEIAVALVSAGIFAALHLGNFFTSDQSLPVTLLQVVYTFFFGICMYLALRVTRTLIAPILLHASTDPVIFLHGEHPVSNVFGIFAGFSTYLVILTGIVLLIVLIVSERRRAKTTTVPSPR